MSENIHRLQKIGFQNLTPLRDAIGRYFALFEPLDIEEIAISDAINRITSDPVTAPISLPPFPRSAMDGYAIRAEDSFGATPSKPKLLTNVGSIPIGGFPDFSINPDEAAEIATGAPIPEGANAVVKVEDTQANGKEIKIFQAIVPDKNVSLIGEDVPEGYCIINSGVEVRPEHVGLMSALGIQKISVRKRPRIALFSTGDELVSGGEELGPGQIYESNTTMNAALLPKYGGEITSAAHIPDDPAIVAQNLQEAVKMADIVVCSGGTSVGTKDFLPQVVQELGEIIVHGIAQKPGSPILLGRVNQVPVICLPGFPVACYIGVVTVLGPLLRQLQGALQADPRQVVYGVMSENVSVKSLGQINHLRVILEENEEGYLVVPKKLAGSGVLRSLTESDGFVEVPPDVEGLEEGQVVKVYLHPR